MTPGRPRRRSRIPRLWTRSKRRWRRGRVSGGCGRKRGCRLFARSVRAHRTPPRYRQRRSRPDPSAGVAQFESSVRWSRIRHVFQVHHVYDSNTETVTAYRRVCPAERHPRLSDREMTMTNLAPRDGPRHVTKIKVRGLFGCLNYDIPMVSQDSVQDDLLIIYGDNGSGKTTILKLLYSTLSARRGEGRRTYLAKTPFEKFEVVLSMDLRSYLKKDPQHLVGGFTQYVINNIGVSQSFEVAAKSDGDLTTNDNLIDELIRSLSQLQVSLYFLPDDRKVQADVNDDTFDTVQARRRRVQPNMLSHLSSVQRPEDGYLVREMNLTLLTPII